MDDTLKRRGEKLLTDRLPPNVGAKRRRHLGVPQTRTADDVLTLRNTGRSHCNVSKLGNYQDELRMVSSV